MKFKDFTVNLFHETYGCLKNILSVKCIMEIKLVNSLSLKNICFVV